MKTRTLIVCIILATASGESLAQMPTAQPAITAEATQALKDVSQALRRLQDYSADMKVSTRAAVGDGQYRDFVGTIGYLVKSPTHISASIDGSGIQRQVYYDGQTITVHAPVERRYAQISAPGSIGTLLETLKQMRGVELPIVDFLEWASAEAPMSDVTRARYQGSRMIAGRACEHYSYLEAGIAWEIWVDADDLPCKLVRVDTADMGLPGYSAEMTWNRQVSLSADDFRFTPEAGAAKVDISVLGQTHADERDR